MKFLKRKIKVVLVVVFVLVIVVSSGFLVNHYEKKMGSVTIPNKILQAKLQDLGYYNGSITGTMNLETKTALQEYQKNEGLEMTGTLDEATQTAVGVSASNQSNTDLYLLAKLIHSEARGEPYEGQVAVGAVVLNRVKSAEFPNTLEEVIYQPWAFTALHDGQFDLEPNATAYQAAEDALNGWDPSYGCLYYYNPTTATSQWIFSRTTVVVIGNHVFAI